MLVKKTAKNEVRNDQAFSFIIFPSTWRILLFVSALITRWL